MACDDSVMLVERYVSTIKVEISRCSENHEFGFQINRLGSNGRYP